MAMTPEEKRERDRLRKRRQRAALKEDRQLEALPRIGRAGTSSSGTESGTSADGVVSNFDAAKALVGELDVKTAAGKYRVALILQLARDLDEPSAIPQRASLSARYTENVDALLAIAKPKEVDELDSLRRKFYTGGVDDIDDDPEAPKRSTRRKA